MKQLFLILTLLFSLHVSAQLTKRQALDTLIWNTVQPLTKEDFQSKRSMYGREIPAYTSSAIYLYQKEDNGQLNFYVEAIFLKSKSYMAKESVYILKHEQIHFDITELYARKLRQLIAQKDFTKVKNVVSEIDRMYKRMASEWQKEENKYDSETQHGINGARQNIWNDNIAAQLKKLEAFAAPDVSMVK
ncbi:MAG: DUF922 domain-containing protein [Bacteroidota bacterium]